MTNLIKFIFIIWVTFPILSQHLKSSILQQAPQLITIGISEVESMILTNYHAHVTINGFIAETNITMTFLNPHDRVLEGGFFFPLPEGSFISGYALDINGVMVDGVVVEKQKGRVVFEKIVRQGIDPGLVEWVEGNSFRTRIFPIPAKGTRTISVKYLSEVAFKNGQPYFYLPLGFKNEIKDFSIRIEVVQVDTEPVVTQGAPGNFQFSRWKKGFVAETALKNFIPKSNLVIHLPQAPDKNIRVEQDSEGDYYFSLHHRLDNSRNIDFFIKAEPRHITILWDASASRRKENHKNEIRLLKEYLSRFQKNPVIVDLVMFRHKREIVKRFTIDKTNIRTLTRILSSTQYDGGTSLSAISPQEREEIPDFYLLFSDGKGNWDNKEPSGFQAPVFAMSGSNWANHSMLNYIARQSGGMYFNLNKIDRKTVLKKIGISPYSFISATVDSGIVSSLYPQSSQPVNDIFIISGKLQSLQAKITLNYGFNNKIIHRESFKISREEATKANLIRTFWAQKMIAYLQIFPRRRREMVETGKRYGLVTPGTSLIVLDNLEQYLEHRIEPPKTLPKMRKDYLLQIKKKEEERKKEREEKMDYLVNLWNERVKWWETSFPRPTVQIKKKNRNLTDTIIFSKVQIPPVKSFADIRENSTQYIIGKVVVENRLIGIQDVLITLDNRETNKSQITFTNEQGDYIFNGIPTGKYNLRADLNGFFPICINDIQLQKGEKLEIGIIFQSPNFFKEINVDVSSGINIRMWSLSGANVSDPGCIGVAPAYLYSAYYNDSPDAPSIVVQEWNPDTPYLKALKKTSMEKAYSVYIHQRKKYGGAPSFYLDCADYFFKKGKKETGIMILSNISEMNIENPSLLRVLGYRLSQLHLLKKAVIIFKKVLEMKPEEPQSYRDLALILAQMSKYEPAVDLLLEVINREWDDRFEGIETIALMEINNILTKARRSGAYNLKDKLDYRLRRLLDVDIRVVLTWDADMTDMDLWVIDPNGEKTYFENGLSNIGGLVSNDFTQGYGPEEFILKKAVKGEYKIMANFFGSGTSKLVGSVTLQVDIFTNYGRKSEKRKSITLRLMEKKEVLDIANVKF